MKKKQRSFRRTARFCLTAIFSFFVFFHLSAAPPSGERQPGRAPAQALKQPISISFGNVSLGKALAGFARTVRVPVIYDGASLGVEKIRIKGKTFINIKAEDVLAYLLKNTSISFKENEEGIHLTARLKEQPGKIVGVVVDEKGSPLSGATIEIEETRTSTASLSDGSFTLDVIPGTYRVKASYVSYGTEVLDEVVVNDGKTTSVRITLKTSSSDANEVVVVGYGTKLKRTVTGAISSVSAKDLVNRPITQASQALYGLLSGVYLNTSTGEAGNNQATIRIRGIGTLNDASALILVDGIEAPIDNINPNDIESVTVLKDASSAAIYGSRAANGVVLVTTKRGKLNSRPTINYTFSAGTSQPTILPKMVTDNRTYLELYREAATNSGTKYSFTDADIDRYAALPSLNWLDVAFRKHAPLQQHAISMRGGSKNAAYSLSLGYLDQDGIIRGGQNYREYNIRSNTDNYIGNKLKIGSSLAFSYGRINLTPKDDATELGGNVEDNALSGKGNLAFEGGLLQHPLVPVYDPLGRYASLEQKLGLTSSRNNEQGILDNQHAAQKDNKLLGIVYAEYEIIKDLKIRGTLGYNYQQTAYNDIREEFSQYDWVTGALVSTINPGSQLYDIQRSTQNLTAFTQASYEKRFGRHGLKGLIGYNQESYDSKANTVEQIDFETTSLITLGSGSSTQKAAASLGSWALRSYFGRLDYDFDNKYLFEFNIRRDGSSRFGANNRYGNFPSLSVGWLVSDEKFWDPRFVNLLKLRASWGILGNQNTALYPFATQVKLSNNYSFNNTVNTGGAYSVIGNPDLRWEQTQSTDIGLDIALFRSRLTVKADYFVKNSTGVLTQIANPLTLGISNATTVNAADVRNKGWEANVNYNDRIGYVTIGAGFTFSYVDNVVRAINPSLSAKSDIVQQNASANQWLARGQSVGVMYGYKVEGIFQSEQEISSAPDHAKLFGIAPKPGDFRLRDMDGNKVIDKDDQTVIGNRLPKVLYGFNFKVGYKGFNLSAIFQGIGRADIYLSRGVAPFPFAGIRQYWLDRWTPEHPSTTIPRLWIDRNGYNGSTIEGNEASFWIQNRAYLRLKNIQLSYTIAPEILRRSFIRNMSLFINAQNLLTFTKLKDFDPERQDQTQYATSSLPQLKIFTGGINLTF